MFEDDVTVPAGWYPDPMGLPQLRWWNNHAWTELTTEARPPLVMQVPTRLAYADEDLPTRRQNREQRERDEQHSALATDGDDAQDSTGSGAPLRATLREIGAPPSASIAEVGTDEGTDEASAEEASAEEASTASEVDPGRADDDRTDGNRTDDDRTDDDPVRDQDDDDPVDDFTGAGGSAPEAFVPRAAFSPIAGSVFGSPVTADSAAEIDESFNHHAQFGSIPPGRSVSRLPIYTAQVWIIALIPLLLLVLSLLLLLGFGSSLNMWVAPTIGLLSYVTVVILAIFDRVALGRAGYEHRASWAWALLTAPIYLLTRSMSLSKVGPLGFAPVLVWTALGILQVGSVLVVPGLIISALPNVFTIQAEQSIAADASIIGAKISVKCSPNLPLLIGQTLHCVAQSAPQDRYDLTVVLERSNGWINWHVTDWGDLHGALAN
jgi:hypothetical protein